MRLTVLNELFLELVASLVTGVKSVTLLSRSRALVYSPTGKQLLSLGQFICFTRLTGEKKKVKSLQRLMVRHAWYKTNTVFKRTGLINIRIFTFSNHCTRT